MTRRVVFVVLLMLAMGVVSAGLAVASPMPGTKIDMEGTDNAFKTGDHYLRTYVAYLVSLVLGIGGATQFGKYPAVGGSMIGGGVLAAIWATVADSATKSVAAATPGMSMAPQMSLSAIWLQRGSYLLSEVLLVLGPLMAWRLQRRRA